MTLAKLLPPSGTSYRSALLYVGVPTTLAVAGYCFYRYSTKKSDLSEEGKTSVNGETTNVANDGEGGGGLATAKTLKEAGNKLFKIGKYDAALELYSKVSEWATRDDK